jgi:HSP20 family molecular chaperone IbpA
MKKIYIIALLFHSGLVLAHSPINNDFESMIKHMFQFGNQFVLGPKGGHFGGPQEQFGLGPKGGHFGGPQEQFGLGPKGGHFGGPQEQFGLGPKGGHFGGPQGQFGLGSKFGHFGGPQGQFDGNQMKMMDMHHKHLFKRTGIKNNEKGWRSVTQSDDENSIKLTITLEGIDKEDLDIHIKKNVLVIRAEKEISGESSHSKQSFMQQFLIPKNIDRSGITAKFEDGVLIVSIPKPTKDNHEIQQITIQ